MQWKLWKIIESHHNLSAQISFILWLLCRKSLDSRNRMIIYWRPYCLIPGTVYNLPYKNKLSIRFDYETKKSEDRNSLPVYCDRLGLPNTMTAVFSLSINLWIKIHVMNYNCISSYQVQTLSSGPCGQQTCKYRGVFVESIHDCLSLCHLCTDNNLT